MAVPKARSLHDIAIIATSIGLLATGCGLLKGDEEKPEFVAGGRGFTAEKTPAK